MIFGWDEAKHARNIQERGYGFDYASLIFEGPVVEWDDDRRDYGEKRRIAVGQADGRVLTVVYTDRDEVR